MLRTRIIPTLLLNENVLVKTINFKKINYIGDPINTCTIFNELEVDELCFLDIGATYKKSPINMNVLKEISTECFMPLSYGGGINSLEQVEKILKIGIEKVVINSGSFTHKGIVSEIARVFGSQALVISVDVKKNLLGKYSVYSHHGTQNQKINPVDWVLEMEDSGAGEILLTSIDREGTWKGFDLDLVKAVTSVASIPVIANGGARNISDIQSVVHDANASAVALGSMVVYQQKDMGVLVNFPDRTVLEKALTK